MKGIIFTELLDFVERHAGSTALEEILERGELSTGGAYTTVGNYPHEEAVRIVLASSAELDAPAADLMRQFGRELFPRFAVLYPQFFAGIDDAPSMLRGIQTTFLHSCGAIYSLLDLIIESNFDIVNPVQWPAGGHSPSEWKEKARGRITLWGGGINSQVTLPLGTLTDVENEVRQVVKTLAQDGGYVFCNIHNILAEIPPEKVISMYRSVN